MAKSHTHQTGGQRWGGDEAAKAPAQSEEQAPEGEDKPLAAPGMCCCMEMLSSHFAIDRIQRGSTPSSKTST